MVKVLAAGRLQERTKRIQLASVHVDSQILSWVGSHAGGNKQLAYNCLMHRSIEVLKCSESAVMVEEIDDSTK